MFEVLICPTAYKGSLSPLQAAAAMAAGVKPRADCRATVLPLADGGDGTLECLNFCLGGEFHGLKVADALGAPLEAHWLELPQVAVVELACASGIARLAKRGLDPLQSQSRGCGELLLDCFHKTRKNIVVTLGGSASTDGGSGLLSALGAKFLDAQGQLLAPGGGFLRQLKSCSLELLPDFSGRRLQVAVDVSNPLLGEQGAAAVFAPQKGASANEVEVLELGLNRWAEVLEAETGRVCRDLPGSGAAGGAAFGLACALRAEIISGFNWLADLLNLDQQIAAADLVVTGEGFFDKQSLSGKVTGGLLQKCRAAQKPIWILPAQVATELPQLQANELLQPLVESNKAATAEDLSAAVAGLLGRYLAI